MSNHDWTPYPYQNSTHDRITQLKKSVREYTLGEEIANSITHGIGALLAIAAIPLCVIKGLVQESRCIW